MKVSLVVAGEDSVGGVHHSGFPLGFRPGTHLQAPNTLGYQSTPGFHLQEHHTCKVLVAVGPAELNINVNIYIDIYRERERERKGER